MTASNYLEYLTGLIQEFLPRYSSQLVERLKDCPLTGPGGVRQLLGEINLEFFARAYFPQYFKFAIPTFHREAYIELDGILNKPPSGARVVRAWPRGNAKSTIYNFFTPCSVALYGKRRFLVQVSDSESQAEGFLADIKNAIENNEYILEDFGEVRGDVWRVDLVVIKDIRGEPVWIAAAGAGSSIRGLRKAEFRPDWIAVDDLESDESVLTVERISRMYTWFQRALMNLGTESTDVVVVGTVLAYESVLDKLLKSPVWDARKMSAIIKWSDSLLWDEWRKIYTDVSLSRAERELQSDIFYIEHEEEMLAGTEVLWPEGKPYMTLMKIYVDVGEAAFHAEHQNDPINFDECLFKPDWISYYSQEEIDKVKIVGYYGALDPSLGRSRLSDYSAFVVLGRGENGVMYVVEAIVERMSPDRIIETLVSLGRHYEFVRFGIEVNQWQDLLRMMVIERSAREGLYLPIVELRHTKDKVIRVQTMLPYVKNRYIRFNPEHQLLVSQLLGFPKLRHDDGPDALEMAVRMVSQGPSMDAMLVGTVPAQNGYDDDDDDGNLTGRHFYS
jgi:predicted phage terminase large subunit-like protein